MQPIYVVLSINLIIWAGMFIYMLGTDKKITELNKKLKHLSENK